MSFHCICIFTCLHLQIQKWGPACRHWLTDKTGLELRCVAGTTQARPRLAFCLRGPMSLVHGSVNGTITLFGIWNLYTLTFIPRILGYYLGYLHSKTAGRLCSREENIITDPRAGVFVSLDGRDMKSWLFLKKGGGVQWSNRHSNLKHNSWAFWRVISRWNFAIIPLHLLS